MFPSVSSPASQERPKSVYFPPIPYSTPVSKIPDSTIDALTNLQGQVNFLKGLKSYDEIKSTMDPSTADVELSIWRNEYAATASTLHKQLALEIFSNILIHCQNMDSQRQELPIVNVNQLYSKLLAHPTFEQYLPCLQTESAQNILKICFNSAINAVNKFEKLNESALKILQCLDKEIKELIDGKEEESLKLLSAFEQANDRMSQKLEECKMKGEYILGKKDFNWCLAKPFHKNSKGYTAPKWEPQSLPFTVQQVRESSWRNYELENLKLSVVQSVIQAKVKVITRRYNQLLMRIYYDTTDGNSIAEDLQQVHRSKFRFKESPYYTTKAKQNPILIHLDDNHNFSRGTKVRLCTDASKLQRWRDERIEKASETTIGDIISDLNLEINWTTVAGKLGKRNYFVRRSPEECSRAWYQLILPIERNEEWTLDKIKLLKNAVDKYGERNWEKVAQSLDLGFSSFQCFYTYERLRDHTMNSVTKSELKQKEMEVGVAGFSKVIELSHKLTPHTARTKFAHVVCDVAEIMSSLPNIPVQQLAEKYNRFTRPALVKGEFSTVEDMLLVVCMVKMREYLKQARNFSPLKHYLPWRFTNNWAQRAESIFRPWRTAWSREQDVQLVELVQNFQSTEEKLDWKFIASCFDISKNRKNARARYELLTRKLQDITFDQYREDYERTTFRVTCSQRLQNLVTSLKEVLNSPRTDVPTAEILRQPTNCDQLAYLNSSSNDLLKQAVSDLEAHVSIHNQDQDQNETCNKEEEQSPVRKSKSLDRRKFIRGDPESTASAIHIRKLTLHLPENVNPVSIFEAQVYKYFDTFKLRSVKGATVHKFIPSAKALISMPEVRRIIDTSHIKNPVIDNVYNVFLDDHGYPVPSETVPAIQKIIKKKSKYQLNRDRRNRLQKMNADGMMKHWRKVKVDETQEEFEMDQAQDNSENDQVQESNDIVMEETWVPEVKVEVELEMEDVEEFNQVAPIEENKV